MDKPNSKITIRINGKEKTYSEEEALAPVPIIVDEVAATLESREEFEWVLPDPANSEKLENQIVEALKPTKGKSNSKTSKRTRKMNRTIFHLLIGFSLAVAIGLAFGLFILQTVTSNFTITNQANVTKETTVATPKEEQSSTKESSRVQVSLAKIDAFVVQGGLFSTKEGAAEGAQLFKERGIPVVIKEQAGKVVLWTGIASTKEAAKQIAETSKQAGLDGYVKAIAIPESKIAVPKSLAEPVVVGTEQIQLALQSAGDYVAGKEFLPATIEKLQKNNDLLKKSKEQDKFPTFVTDSILLTELILKKSPQASVQKQLLVSLENYDTWLRQ